MQIVNATKTSLSPGYSLPLNYYISGYGYIDFTSAKTFFSSSAEIINSNESLLLAMAFLRDTIQQQTPHYMF
ncbi:hypothetical protein [Confluentibacter citreus]|uniref:hypothetical protein n=1 Tax=Confluentibacter citreus TaxID=2007307 RepID=UPI000C28EE10|nr:hypothetical protein [Confluentibacter citreus]